MFLADVEFPFSLYQLYPRGIANIRVAVNLARAGNAHFIKILISAENNAKM